MWNQLYGSKHRLWTLTMWSSLQSPGRRLVSSAGILQRVVAGRVCNKLCQAEHWLLALTKCGDNINQTWINIIITTKVFDLSLISLAVVAVIVVVVMAVEAVPVSSNNFFGGIGVFFYAKGKMWAVFLWLDSYDKNTECIRLNYFWSTWLW